MKIGRVEVGGNSHVKVMGVINASPESFYKGSVKIGTEAVAQASRAMQEAGAHMIDIGAMSTAPYLETVIPVEEETRRMLEAIDAVKSACDLPISADTPRAQVAEAAAKAGVDAINDVTGLKYDRKMDKVVAKSGLPLIACAYSSAPARGSVASTVAALKASMTIAKKAGIRDVLVDPSIGFFRSEGKNPFFTKMTDLPWYTRDLQVLSGLRRIVRLAPVCVSVSRKSFMGHLLHLDTEERLAPSIACEIVSAINGASVIRTHSVKEIVHALAMLDLLQ